MLRRGQQRRSGSGRRLKRKSVGKKLELGRRKRRGKKRSN
jgi:hypothetical protein